MNYYGNIMEKKSIKQVLKNLKSQQQESTLMETYGLYVIMMCQCQCIQWNKCSPPLRDVGNGGAYTCVGQGVYGKPLYLPLTFAVNLKLLQT